MIIYLDLIDSSHNFQSICVTSNMPVRCNGTHKTTANNHGGDTFGTVKDPHVPVVVTFKRQAHDYGHLYLVFSTWSSTILCLVLLISIGKFDVTFQQVFSPN